MNLDFLGSVLIIGFFLMLLICFELGRRIGKAGLVRHSKGLVKEGGAVEVGVYGLLGLLIALTFTGALSRFEARRLLITQESNAISTAYRRIDLLPADTQPALRKLFRAYLDSRLETYRRLPSLAAARAELTNTYKLQDEIWNNAIAACREPCTQAARMLLFPALNQMFDSMGTRLDATQNHPPMVIYLLLVALCLIAALLAGYGMAEKRERSWFHILVFSLTLALAVYVIIDLEFPRVGLIQITSGDQTLIHLRHSF
jgi:hypothetical protein